MTVTRMKRRFIIAALLLTIGVLFLTAMLNMASFRNQAVVSMVNSHVVTARETVQKIEYAVKYGKPLDNFYGMQDMLEEIKVHLPFVEDTGIVMRDGLIVESVLGPKNALLSEAVLEKAAQASVSQGTYLDIQHHQLYTVLLPIHSSGDWIGSLYFVFHQDHIDEQMKPYMWALMRSMLLCTLLALLALTAISYRISPITQEGEFNRKALLIMMVAVMGSAQLLFGLSSYQLFKNAYLEQTQTNIASVAAMITRDIQSVINKGVGYHQFYEIEAYLKNLQESIPEMSAIHLVSKGQVLYGMEPYEAGLAWTAEETGDFAYQASLPVQGEIHQPVLHITLSREHLNQHLGDIILDTLTVLATSVFLMVEFTFFLTLYMYRWIHKGLQKESVQDDGVAEVFVRTMAFVTFTGVFMSTAFIPVLMKSIYQPVPGIPEEVMLGLPITVNFMMGAIATIVAGKRIDQSGWRMTFWAGISALAAGTLVSGLATTPLIFVLARGLTGAGYGFTLMALRGFVLTMVSEKEVGYASLNAGLYSGMICGVALGSMMAERIPYSGVFFTALVIIVLAGLFSIVFSMEKPDALFGEKQRGQRTKSASWVFLTNPSVVLFFATILLPTAACMMFLDYFLPLLTQELNLPIAHVGRAFLLNGACIVYLGPWISKTLGKRFPPHQLVITGGLHIVAAMMVFALFGGLWAAFAAAILLGIADSFGLVAQTKYLLQMSASQQAGYGVALGYYSNVKKIGQMMGPLVFGLAISMGSRQGIGFIGVGIAVLIVVFTYVRSSHAVESGTEEIVEA